MAPLPNCTKGTPPAVLGITALQACLDSVAHAAEGHPQAGLLMWLVAIELARGTVL